MDQLAFANPANSHSKKPASFALWLVLAVATGYLVFAGGTFLGIQTAPGRIANLLITLLFVVPWLAVSIVRPEPRPRSVFLIPILICAATFTLSTVASQNARVSLEAMGNATLLVSLYLLMTTTFRSAFVRQRFGALALGLSVALSIAYLAQVAPAWLTWWIQDVGRLAPPPLRPGYFGLGFQAPIPVALLVVSLAAVGLASLDPAAARRRWIWAAVLIVDGLAVLILASRAVWLAALVGVIVVALVEARPTARLVAYRLNRRLIAAVGIAAAALVAVAAPSVISRIGDAGGFDLRAELAAVSLRIFAVNPLTGTGPGTWPLLRAAHTQAGEVDFWSPHAHNVYLHSLAELGLLGAASLTLVLLSAVWLIRSGLRSPDPWRRRIAIGATFVLVFSLVEELFGYAVNLPALLFAFGLPVALLDATQPLEAKWAWAPMGRWPAVVLLAGVIVSVVGLGRAAVGATTADAALVRLSEGDRDGAIANIQASIRVDPALPLYSLIYGMAAAEQGDFVRARPLLLSVAESDDLAETWVNLAYVDLQLGMPDRAADDLSRAERLGVQRATVSVAASWLRTQLGDRAGAVRDLAFALVVEPSLADDPQLAKVAQFAPIRDDAIRAASGQAAPRALFEILLRTGAVGRATEVARSLDVLAAPGSQLVVGAWSGDEDAWARLQQLAVQDPQNEWNIGWCARIARKLGDAAGATRYDEWLQTLDPLAEAAFAWSLRLIPDGALGRTLNWTVASDYGYAVYRQASPASLLLTGLPRLTHE